MARKPSQKRKVVKTKPAPAEAPAEEVKRPRGNQTVYTRELAEEVCWRMANGQTLNQIAKAPGMPPRTTVIQWKMDNRDGFADRYARARQDLLDYWADEAIDISDDGTNDYVRDDEGKIIVNHDVINRSRLRVDTRKWMLARLKPEYADKSHVDLNVKNTPEEMTDEQLERIACSGGAGAVTASKRPEKLN